MIVAADNLNVVNPVVAAALQNLEAEPLQDLARRCEQAGAKILDINPGFLSARHEDRMVFMVEAVQRVSRLRLMLDSPNPRVLAKGLAACEQTPVLNALTLEEEKLREILPLAAAHDADLAEVAGVEIVPDRRRAGHVVGQAVVRGGRHRWTCLFFAARARSLRRHAGRHARAINANTRAAQAPATQSGSSSKRMRAAKVIVPSQQHSSAK